MLTHWIVWMNSVAGSLAAILLAPVAWLPGWVSANLIAAATGVGMLAVFKYTSNQTEIKRTRSRIKANLLALSLFQEDLRVGLRCQLDLLRGARQMLALSLVPMALMFLPMCLTLGQIGLWYQARPLRVGEEAVVTVHFNNDKSNRANETQADPELELASDSIEITVGPIRVPSKHMVCWNITAQKPGLHELIFKMAGESFTKQIAIGNGFMPTSLKRPGWNLSEALLHPRENPFVSDSPIQSIEIDFPGRISWITGSNWWLIYWFFASMIFAYIVSPLLRVNL